MEYQFDSGRGVHCCYKELDEDGDYSFFCDANLKLKNLVEVVCFDDNNSKNKTNSVLVDYSEVQELISSENIIQIFTNEEESGYSIIISAGEVWVRSFDRHQAINVYKMLFNIVT